MHAVFKLTHHSFLQPFIVLQLDVVQKPTYMCLYMQDRWRERSVYIYIYIYICIFLYLYILISYPCIHHIQLYIYIYTHTHTWRETLITSPLKHPLKRKTKNAANSPEIIRAL